MEFLNIQNIKEDLKSRQRVKDHQYFEGLEFNNTKIYIGASENHYCLPRQTFPILSYYTHIQIAIYEVVKEEERIISPFNDERYKNFGWAKYFIFTDNSGRQVPSYMGDKIPFDDVCQLIRDVYKTSRLKAFF